MHEFELLIHLKGFSRLTSCDHRLCLRTRCCHGSVADLCLKPLFIDCMKLYKNTFEPLLFP